MEELRIIIPEGQEIDWKESSKQEKIVFKSKTFKPRSWEEYCNKTKWVGYYIDDYSNIECAEVDECYLRAKEDKNLLPTKELAESFLAMMQLMSLRQAWIGDWKPNWAMHNFKYAILFVEDKLIVTEVFCNSRPLSFPTKEMADEFVECFSDLINQTKILL